MSQQSYVASIQAGGTSTPFDKESTIQIGTMENNTLNKIFQVKSSPKRIFDRQKNVSMYLLYKKNAQGYQQIDISKIEDIDYMFGIIKFNESIAEPVFITGYYIPTKDIAGATSFNMNWKTDILDFTSFDSVKEWGQYHLWGYGLSEVVVTLGRIDDFSNVFKTNIDKPIVINIQPGGKEGESYRGWYYISKKGNEGDVNSIEMENLEFVLSVNEKTNFSIGKA